MCLESASGAISIKMTTFSSNSSSSSSLSSSPSSNAIRLGGFDLDQESSSNSHYDEEVNDEYRFNVFRRDIEGPDGILPPQKTQSIIKAKKDIQQNHLLHKLKLGDYDGFQALLTPENINTTSGSGDTLLMLAIENNLIEIVMLLINRDADVTCQNQYGRAALHLAVVLQNMEIIQLLIDKGADLNAEDESGDTPLHYAVTRDSNVEIVRLLVANNAEINGRGFGGSRPLFLATLYNAVEVTKLLLQNGADMYVHSTNEEGSLLYIAARRGLIDIVRMLLEQIKQNESVSGMYDPNVNEVLHYAVEGNIETVQYLIDIGIGVNTKDRNGNTPLHHATMLSANINSITRLNALQMMKLLLENNANINAQNESGETPLFLAASRNCIDACRLLLSLKANFNICAWNDSFDEVLLPIHIAYQNKHMECVQAIEDRKHELRCQLFLFLQTTWMYQESEAIDD